MTINKEGNFTIEVQSTAMVAKITYTDKDISKSIWFDIIELEDLKKLLNNIL